MTYTSWSSVLANPLEDFLDTLYRLNLNDKPSHRLVWKETMKEYERFYISHMSTHYAELMKQMNETQEALNEQWKNQSLMT